MGMGTESGKRAAIFVDRDGTINEEVGYLDRLENLQLIPGAAEAIRLINASGRKVVVVTNQSGVARGLFAESFVAETHACLNELLRAKGARIDAFYFCPHHPTEGRGEYRRECDCRKPAPGLLLRAAAELHLDCARCHIVGDTLQDIAAGAAAGVRGILVRTGHGEEAASKLGAAEGLWPNGQGRPDCPPDGGTGPRSAAETVRPIHIAADLLAAVQWILKREKR